MQLSELSINPKDSAATICINDILQKIKRKMSAFKDEARDSWKQ